MGKSDFKKGYKVVRKGMDGKFISAILCDSRAYTYSSEEVTKRRGGWGSIAVFQHGGDAEDFSKQHRGTVIKKCTYLPSIDGDLYYKDDDTGKRIYIKWTFPLGICFADEVILEEG